MIHTVTPDQVSHGLAKPGAALLACCALLLASGCATMRSVDVDVTSFASWPGGVPASTGSTYRFERLPSQQPGAIPRDRLETITRDALARKGLQLSPTLAQYSVQASLNTQLASDGYSGNSPYGGSNIGISTGVFSGGGGGGGFGGISFGFPLGGAGTGSSGYRIELVILLRSLQTHAVVYESRAYALMPSAEDPAVIGAMVDAALRGFPVPLTGPQRVRIELVAPVR